MGPYLGMPIYIYRYIYRYGAIPIYIYHTRKQLHAKCHHPFRHEASLPSKMLALVQVIVAIYSLHATNISGSY